ncbi:hypothetical protein C7I87_21715 [Mesorhizobium sp. SARCC-RB16n]|uniref:hypothetical protein n=1 Tax=Mesorhizobium sp. SARCC-RB16n TaxID=2116687 RepID=UPI00122EC03A|nr:hypothetical protein [Mesorhizobium sp. SARCC-RB16n]KAA3448453.1 hypothetical protein C7I87_21715 [Mesorhizobium sp. SARCC-RB16n]
MTARDPDSLQTEPTPEGEQTLVPGVRPTSLRPPKRASRRRVTTRDRLAVLMDAPMRSRAAQKPRDIGLFDKASRNQLTLF